MSSGHSPDPLYSVGMLCMHVCFAHYDSVYPSQPHINMTTNLGMPPFTSLDLPLSSIITYLHVGLGGHYYINYSQCNSHAASVKLSTTLKKLLAIDCYCYTKLFMTILHFRYHLISYITQHICKELCYSIMLIKYQANSCNPIQQTIIFKYVLIEQSAICAYCMALYYSNRVLIYYKYFRSYWIILTVTCQ